METSNLQNDEIGGDLINQELGNQHSQLEERRTNNNENIIINNDANTQGDGCSNNEITLSIDAIPVVDDVNRMEEDGNEQNQVYDTEFLNSLNPSGAPPHRLVLKVGAIVMLIRNINTSIGLCNGTRLKVEGMMNHLLRLRVLSGPFRNRVVSLPKMAITPSDTRLPFQLKRVQFPVIPSFAITINKSQGQSFDCVGVDLTQPIFSHGQLYVAVSRCRSKEKLKFHIPTSDNQQQPRGRRRRRGNEVEMRTVQNVVFTEVLPQRTTQ